MPLPPEPARRARVDRTRKGHVPVGHVHARTPPIRPMKNTGPPGPFGPPHTIHHVTAFEQTWVHRPVQLVWLKRDLRVFDHPALAHAFAATERDGSFMLGLFVFEAEMWSAPDADRRHFDFVVGSLRELRAAWAERGGVLLVRMGEIPNVLDRLRVELRDLAALHFSGLWSHEETGNAISYARDRRVARWCRTHHIPWTEIPQNGVVRRLADRDGWADIWQHRMDARRHDPPARIPSPPLPGAVPYGEIPESNAVGVAGTSLSCPQAAGERAAQETLRSFLRERGLDYQRAMSSPLHGEHACSRLSPHLAWGTISIRTAHQSARAHALELRTRASRGEAIDPRWARSLRSFESRLRWHCHFMQKLESEPDIEHHNMNRAYDGLREDFSATPEAESRFAAWKAGRTGYPMIDACMRSLVATGWLNFRMRAMLASFASYHLWLHWREPSVFLARQFTDYEPGIHYPQFQMQSGVTGINTIRIYSPAKQARDNDPTGVFIRRWVPELARVPDEFLPEPHAMPPLTQAMAGCIIGEDYPAPIVDHRTAYAHAQRQIFRLRASPDARDAARDVLARHGSRKRPPARSRSRLPRDHP